MNEIPSPELLDQFECKVCYNYLFPPIRMCENGHNFCNNCFTLTHLCPYCRGQKLDDHNFKLEKAVKLFSFPCSNKDEGCGFIGVPEEVVSHLKACDYTIINCPFSVYPITTCNWKGSAHLLLSHCRQHHSENVRSRDTHISIQYEDGACVQIIHDETEEPKGLLILSIIKFTRARYFQMHSLFDRKAGFKISLRTYKNSEVLRCESVSRDYSYFRDDWRDLKNCLVFPRNLVTNPQFKLSFR